MTGDERSDPSGGWLRDDREVREAREVLFDRLDKYADDLEAKYAHRMYATAAVAGLLGFVLGAMMNSVGSDVGSGVGSGVGVEASPAGFLNSANDLLMRLVAGETLVLGLVCSALLSGRPNNEPQADEETPLPARMDSRVARSDLDPGPSKVELGHSDLDAGLWALDNRAAHSDYGRPGNAVHELAAHSDYGRPGNAANAVQEEAKRAWLAKLDQPSWGTHGAVVPTGGP